jgi:tRNA U34 5-methylaminomethyl-2-thiouridine-forming methyltransferase MnmC
MERSIYATADSSNTIYLKDLDETYHSGNGALQEAIHVYINTGFKNVTQHKNNIHIFEVGFGTGLNTILTLIEANKNNIQCIYHAIEAFPLEKELVSKLHYKNLIDSKYHSYFDAIHDANWDEEIAITPTFILKKINTPLETYIPEMSMDLIYFDAFAPDKQPELWTEKIFCTLYGKTNIDGVFVTYSSKGEVRRNLQHVGFTMEKLNGPIGKRHILRGIKR